MLGGDLITIGIVRVTRLGICVMGVSVTATLVEVGVSMETLVVEIEMGDDVLSATGLL